MTQQPDIALNRPATQSSTAIWSTSQNPSEDAKVATSGGSDCWFHTGHETSPWWQVDLEDIYLIKQVVIVNRPTFRERLRFFTLFRSFDGVSWLPFFKRTDSSSFEVFTADIGVECLARYIRVQVDGTDFLHFKQCRVQGSSAPKDVRDRLRERDENTARMRRTKPAGRSGQICDIESFAIFNDDAYNGDVRGHLQGGGGQYEGRERQLVREFLRPADRVLEAGTAIGLVAMTAASIVGGANVVTFEANPNMVAASRDNFLRNGFEKIGSNHGALVNRSAFTKGGEIDFFIANDFLVSRIKPNARDDILEAVRIPTFCLEDELEKHSANVLICDIEGGEVDLLATADLSPLRLIIIETHYWAAGERETDDMMRALFEQGFSPHLGSSGHHVFVLRR